MQKAKALILEIKRGSLSKGEIEKRLEKIFGAGSSQEIETATSKEKIVERIEEMSKREEQFDEWEKIRKESKRCGAKTEDSTSSGGKTNVSLCSLEETMRPLTQKKR